MKTVTVNYEVIPHGVEHEQYFQGCGVAFTPYEHCVTGIGSTAQEAYDDALEMMAQSHPEAAEQMPDTQPGLPSAAIQPDEDSEGFWFYLSIRYSVVEA